MRRAFPLSLCLVALLLAASAAGQAPVAYTFSFPEAEHRWMQVEVRFENAAPGPLSLRMSRSSPGRYSLHDFARNVYDVTASVPDGRSLPLTRPDPYGWTVDGHDGQVVVRYKVFGDRVDGTYLAIDPTHAHINMPAAAMWARGFEDRPVVVTLMPPPGREWRAATQLHAGDGPFEFTAPNLQYFMDSPLEFGPGQLREFRVGDQRIRVALHHAGSDAELDRFAADVEKIVREQEEIFGELPEFEPGHYTVLADYLPYASGDGMEHRNSTVVTSSSALADNRLGLLETVSHEFFHAWNVERIRPRSLEPFDFDRANMSGELWLGEGFTSYYGALALVRAGLTDVGHVAGSFNNFISSVAENPARLVRSAVEMSRMAPFVDGGQTVDRTNWSNTYIWYYPFGAAIALGLDPTLRERSDGAATLDDYMRAMWRKHGKPGGARPGFVDHPYTLADAEARLAEVSGDAAFARDFFARYIEGHEVADYARLLRQAGLRLRAPGARRASFGEVRLDDRGGAVRVASPPPFGSPLYAAGLELDDEVRQLDGRPVRRYGDVSEILGRRAPGDRISITFVNRTGTPRSATVLLTGEPGLELVPIESTGAALSPAERRFRDYWLN